MLPGCRTALCSTHLLILVGCLERRAPASSTFTAGTHPDLRPGPGMAAYAWGAGFDRAAVRRHPWASRAAAAAAGLPAADMQCGPPLAVDCTKVGTPGCRRRGAAALSRLTAAAPENSLPSLAAEDAVMTYKQAAQCLASHGSGPPTRPAPMLPQHSPSSSFITGAWPSSAARSRGLMSSSSLALTSAPASSMAAQGRGAALSETGAARSWHECACWPSSVAICTSAGLSCKRPAQLPMPYL